MGARRINHQKRTRSFHRLLALTSPIILVLACSRDSELAAPAATFEMRLAGSGAGITLRVEGNDGVLEVRLDTNGSLGLGNGKYLQSYSCAHTHAQATANGAAMEVVSPGEGTVQRMGGGIYSGGDVHYDVLCIQPTFRATMPPNAFNGEIDVRIFDETATYSFRGEALTPTIVFSKPNDGVLHIGTWSELTLNPMAPAEVSVSFRSNDASKLVFSATAFEACFVPDGGVDAALPTCNIIRTGDGVAFLVPDVEPQAGFLEVVGSPPWRTLVCDGVAACSYQFQPAPPPPRLAVRVER